VAGRIAGWAVAAISRAGGGESTTTTELGDTFRLGLTIAKMRANPVNRVTHEVEVLDGQGMRVLKRELRVPAEKHPFSSYAGLVSRAPERRKLAGRASETP
jgi:hypothetical protein